MSRVLGNPREPDPADGALARHPHFPPSLLLGPCLRSQTSQGWTRLLPAPQTHHFVSHDPQLKYVRPSPSPHGQSRFLDLYASTLIQGERPLRGRKKFFFFF
jgi:hypothetical protein